MTSYTSFARDANYEIDRGYSAVVAGNYRVAAGCVSIRDYDDTPLRQASPLETAGVIRALDAIVAGELTDYSAETRRMLDLAVALADSDIDLDWFAGVLAQEEDWHDYCDTRESIRYGFQMF